MSHFVDYYLEERGETVYRSDRGFITYKIYEKSKEIMICDFFVAKEFRGTKEAKSLGDVVSEIGRKNGCTHLSCYIQTSDKSEEGRKRTTFKIKLYIHYGLSYHSGNEDQILMYKDL